MSIVDYNYNTFKIFQIQNQLPEDGSATLNDTIDIQLSTWQSFYQTCLQYQKFVSKPLGITKPTADGFVVVKKVSISSDYYIDLAYYNIFVVFVHFLKVTLEIL